ncbi:MAG: metallophosphoesterase [Myxococcota bacterium]
MPLRIRDAELIGRSDSSLTLSFRVEDETGHGVAEPARIRLGDQTRTSPGDDGPGTRLFRFEGLDADRSYALEIESEAGEPAAHDEYFPQEARTLPAPTATEVATFATLNDVHFGEPKIGGVMTEDHEYGEEAPGFPVIRETDTETPYPVFMNTDAVSEINALGVDAALIKGDIADRGRPEQFADARACFSHFEMPHFALLGNHDYLAQRDGIEVDGYALLGQEPAPRRVELGGWHLLLLETALPGKHHGVFGEERLAWLDEALGEADTQGAPVLIVMHHQPVPPAYRDSYPNLIGMVPEDSMRFFAVVGEHACVRAALIGHTHRNRVRRYTEAGNVLFAETSNSKDFPGSFTHYRLFADGSLHQEVRRIGSLRALKHSTRCRELFRGMYRVFSLGALEERSFAIPAKP